jgi:hypothetical protein
MKSKKFKKFLSDTRLRVTLLRIWFVKNLIVFLRVFLFVSVILVIMGKITPETPVLGILFGPLSVEISNVLNQNYDNSTAINIITVVFSLLITIGVFSAKLKSITLSDIKSIKTKRALVAANLYFNSNGRLAKKIEEVAKIDLTGDGMIGDTDISAYDIEHEPLFSGVKRSFGELKVIMSASIETEPEVQEIIQTAGLKEAQQLDTEIRDTMIESVGDLAVKEASDKIDQDSKLTTETKRLSKISFIRIRDRIVSFTKKLFTRKERPATKETVEEVKFQMLSVDLESVVAAEETKSQVVKPVVTQEVKALEKTTSNKPLSKAEQLKQKYSGR